MKVFLTVLGDVIMLLGAVIIFTANIIAKKLKLHKREKSDIEINSEEELEKYLLLKAALKVKIAGFIIATVGILILFACNALNMTI